MDGAVEDLSGQVPERHVDASDRRDVRQVGVYHRGHGVEMAFDGERVVSDEEGLHLFDAGAQHRSRGGGFAVAHEARVGENLEEACPAIAEVHGPDIGDLDLVGFGGG